LDREKYKIIRGAEGDSVLSFLEGIDGKAYETRIVLYIVITKHNADELEDIILFGKERNLGVYFQALQNDLNNKEISEVIKSLCPTSTQIEHLSQLFRKITSNRDEYSHVVTSDAYLAGIASYYINPRAKPSKCHAAYTRVNIDKFHNLLPCWQLESVGNVKEESVLNIWKSKKMRKARRRIRHLDCPGCWFPCHIETSITKGLRT
jgi:MoaA/NifB/PqqE/SkfB family radical SAM enzyme